MQANRRRSLKQRKTISSCIRKLSPGQIGAPQTGVVTDDKTGKVDKSAGCWGARSQVIRFQCSASCRLTFIEGAAGAFHFFQDVAGSGGPDERFWTFVVTVDVGANGYDEFFQVAEDAAPEPILSEVAKEAFHHVEP